MIECRLGAETKGRYIRAKGDLAELATDLAMLINNIYNSIQRQRPEAAEDFANGFQRMLTDLKDEIFGPDMLEGVSIGTMVEKQEEAENE